MMANKSNKVYFAKNTQTGGEIGLWLKKSEVREFVSNHSKRVGVRYEVVEKMSATCPYCDRITDADTLEAFGMCMLCDHVQGEAIEEMRENV